MKNVEPFIKLDDVLDYETPSPPKPPIDTLRDAFEAAVDSVGGPVVALLIAMVTFVTIGLSVGGMIGALFVAVGYLLFQSLVKYWQNSSRW
jgi:hypothetical protein